MIKLTDSAACRNIAVDKYNFCIITYGRSKNHTFAYYTAHFSWCKVSNDNNFFADHFFRCVPLCDTAENIKKTADTESFEEAFVRIVKGVAQ